MASGLLHDLREVGENLQDHLDVSLMASGQHARRPSGFRCPICRARCAPTAPFSRDGTGEFTSNIAEAGGFVRSGPGARPAECAVPLHPRLSARSRPADLVFGFMATRCSLRPPAGNRGRIRLALTRPGPPHPSIFEPDYSPNPQPISDTKMLKSRPIGPHDMTRRSLPPSQAVLHPRNPTSGTTRNSSPTPLPALKPSTTRSAPVGWAKGRASRLDPNAGARRRRPARWSNASVMP